MNKIDIRIRKLEDAVKPNTPHCLLAFSQEEANQKKLEYQKAHPREAEPLIIIVEFIAAPASKEPIKTHIKSR
jgi:hypothetical protein